MEPSLSEFQVELESGIRRLLKEHGCEHIERTVADFGDYASISLVVTEAPLRIELAHASGSFVVGHKDFRFEEGTYEDWHELVGEFLDTLEKILIRWKHGGIPNRWLDAGSGSSSLMNRPMRIAGVILGIGMVVCGAAALRRPGMWKVSVSAIALGFLFVFAGVRGRLGRLGT